MTRGLWTQALVVLAIGAAGNWNPACATEFRCWNGDQERRIELSGPDATRGIVCEVRYWQDAKAPDSGRVLWLARQDSDFCAVKARDLVSRLEAGGWTCASSEQPEPTQTQRAASPPAADAPAQVSPVLEPEEPAVVGPAEPSPPALARTRPSPAGAPIVPPSANPGAALLDRVVKETLRSVEELYGGEFQAEHAAFGDLDGDGVDDAAVLITYQADRDDYVQYLVAYLFNGETFQSVATKNVGGRFLDALRADLQGIADRRILVELEALDGDGACCATRGTAFALERGQLVEVADPGAERTSQAERSSPG